MTGQIPSEIGTVTSLQVIDIGKILLKSCGTVLISINFDNKSDYFVSLLLTFTTGDNDLSGEIPPEIGNLALLENFDAGKIATIRYIVTRCKSYVVFANLYKRLLKQRRK